MQQKNEERAVNRDQFSETLRVGKFNEVLEKSLPPSDHNAAHSHAFDVRALVTQGEITLTIDGVATPYREGDIFMLAAGCEHIEDVGSEGVTYLVGWRYVM